MDCIQIASKQPLSFPDSVLEQVYLVKGCFQRISKIEIVPGFHDNTQIFWYSTFIYFEPTTSLEHIVERSNLVNYFLQFEVK